MMPTDNGQSLIRKAHLAFGKGELRTHNLTHRVKVSGYKIVNQKSIHFEVASLGLKYSCLSLLSAKSVKSENYTTVTFD